ncbi:Elongator complex protein 4 [Penicillium chermesinum]|nr:Elongator complex protein 4 [Penicillium chermesinum]
MSFRKRNIGVSTGIDRNAAPTAVAQAALPESNPDDGRPTTSTGCPSLDGLLAGHAGLPMGKILLIEENGTTEFAGQLLRYYAAEGVVQEQKIHVVGMPEQWGRSLPGLIGTADILEGKRSDKRKDERMKIAWRYERLGEFGAGIAGSRDAPPQTGDSDGAQKPQQAFCHAFDLTKRFTHPSITNMTFIPLTPSKESPYASILKRLQSAIQSSSPSTIHRIVIPSLLNPGLYPPDASRPEYVLQFLHSLKALMTTHSSRVTAMLTLPLTLFPRSSGLVRWIELLCDGVIELCPFPSFGRCLGDLGGCDLGRRTSAGMLKTHRLPVLHERGGGNDQNIGQDWAFNLSRRRFEIKPFSLPPAEGDKEAQEASVPSGMPKKADLEF